MDALMPQGEMGNMAYTDGMKYTHAIRGNKNIRNMNFENNTIYHIYNQGNQQRQIFYSQENYYFFMRKMRKQILPFGEMLCYCLMPNHFHWLFYVKTNQAFVERRDSKPKEISLNESISVLLRSYTRAINKQEGLTGSLFRQNTKAKDGWEVPNLNAADPEYGKVWRNWELYGATCFQYIHQNPVKAQLVWRAEDWPYSSAADFAGLRNGTMCNQHLAKELLWL